MSDEKASTPTMYVYRNAGAPGAAVTATAKEFKALDEADQETLVAWAVEEMTVRGVPIKDAS